MWAIAEIEIKMVTNNKNRCAVLMIKAKKKFDNKHYGIDGRHRICSIYSNIIYVLLFRNGNQGRE